MMLGYEFHEVLLPYALPSHGTDGATSARRGKMHMHLVRAICIGIFPPIHRVYSRTISHIAYEKELAIFEDRR